VCWPMTAVNKGNILSIRCTTGKDRQQEDKRFGEKGRDATMFQLTTDRVASDHPAITRVTYPSYREELDRKEILRVLDRAASDNGFIALLTYRGSDALQGYHLTSEAKAALLSGDIRWIEDRVGKLDARLSTWLWCRLQQEIW
jgi:hypothetical protein